MDALTDLNRALEINPKDYSAYGVRSEVKSNMDDTELGMQDANQAIALNDRDSYTYRCRALVREKRGDLDGAIFDFTAAAGLNPEAAANYFGRANAEYLKGQWTKALADFHKALQRVENGPEYPPALHLADSRPARASGGSEQRTWRLSCQAPAEPSRTSGLR